MTTDYYSKLDPSFTDVKRHILNYQRDGIRLHFYVTQVTLHTDNKTPNDLTLIVCHGLAMSMFSGTSSRSVQVEPHFSRTRPGDVLSNNQALD